MPCWYLFLITSAMASGFIFPICGWGEVMCLQCLPSAVEHLGTPYQVSPDRGGIWTRERYFPYDFSVWERGRATNICAACFLYNAYPVSPECGESALLSVENYSLVFWLHPRPLRFRAIFPNAAICKPVVVNLCKLGSCLMYFCCLMYVFSKTWVPWGFWANLLSWLRIHLCSERTALH